MYVNCDDDKSHYICCADDNRSLCDRDLTGVPWREDDDNVELWCPPCHYLINTSFCPLNLDCAYEQNLQEDVENLIQIG